MRLRLFSVLCALIACVMLAFGETEDIRSQVLVTLLLGLVAIQLYFEQGSTMDLQKVDFDDLKKGHRE